MVYPGSVVFSTVEVPVVTQYIIINTAGSSVSSSLFTSVIPPDPTLTWEYSGVPLTYPTVYAAYETFSHISVKPVGTACVSSTLTLALPSPTVYEPLIVVYSDIPDTDFVAPTVVSYLNSLETVTQQLGQTIGPGACDPLSPAQIDDSDPSRGTTTVLVSRSSVGTVTQTIYQGVQEPTLVERLSDMLPSSSAPQPSSSRPPTSCTTPIPSNTPPPVFSASVVSVSSKQVPVSSITPPSTLSSAAAFSSIQARSSVSITVLPSSSSQGSSSASAIMLPSSSSQILSSTSITVLPPSSSQAPPSATTSMLPSFSSQAVPPVSVTVLPFSSSQDSSSASAVTLPSSSSQESSYASAVELLSSNIQALPSVSDIILPTSSIAFSSSSLADSTSQGSVPVSEPSSMGIPSSSAASVIPSLVPTQSTTDIIDETRSASLPTTSPLEYTGGAAAPTGRIAGLLLGAAGFGLGLF